MNILATIGLWLVKIASSELFQSIIKTVVSDLVQTGKEELPYVQAAVKEAMSHDDWTGAQKLAYVQNTVKARFPNISNSLLNRLVENVYAALSITPPTS
jgi:hypothetical protein